VLGGSGCLSDLPLGLGPSRGREFLDLSNLGGGQAREQILQIVKRVDLVPPATAEQCVKDCTAFSSRRMANEQPSSFQLPFSQGMSVESQPRQCTFPSAAWECGWAGY
jgi:hypothetical protein